MAVTENFQKIVLKNNSVLSFSEQEIYTAISLEPKVVTFQFQIDAKFASCDTVFSFFEKHNSSMFVVTLLLQPRNLEKS